MENLNISTPVNRKIGYTSLILSLSSIILLLAVGFIIVLTQPFFGSFIFYIKNIFLFFGYIVISPSMLDFKRIIVLILYIIFIFLPLAAFIVALAGSRKKKKNWFFLISVVTSLALFSFYIYRIVSLIM